MGVWWSNSNAKKPRGVNKNIKVVNLNQIRCKYNINPTVLGSGTYGKVFLASLKSNPNIKFAIKTLPKSKLSDSNLNDIKEEIKILQTLDHPNIIKYIETFENKKNMYLVMELCEGEELFSKLTKLDEPFTEQEAAIIMRKLFHAISHCHANNIAHRDLKPENIMFKKKGGIDHNEIKIIDFGLSKQNKNKKVKMKTICGTPYYVAPEVLNENPYTSAWDVWSLGVIMYIMLSGFLPFHGNTMAEIYDKIIKEDPSFDNVCWENISNDAIQLIK